MEVRTFTYVPMYVCTYVHLVCVPWSQCLVLARVHCVCRGHSVWCWHVYTVCVVASVSGVGTVVATVSGVGACTLCVL